MKPLQVDVGSHVWVGDPEVAWLGGIVLNIKGQDAEIQTSNGKTIVASLSKIYPKDVEAPVDGVDDMTKLQYLHEPAVLHNLASRYAISEIYTYTGNILIAVNPFQKLPHLYDVDMMERYKGSQIGELHPHVFAIADVAYRRMINEGQSNSILVSGESGAGKTETTKMLMKYLAHLGGHNVAEGWAVEERVLESNPVLEAFGNAKTVRNNNSSRFGKFVEIQFDQRGRISGAAIRTYLLEKSRVCQISDSERNYHCFYLLCAAPPEEIEKYKLGDPKSFHYLNQSNCYELADIDEAQDYLATRRAMDIIGMSEKEQEAIFRVVAAILHLGNICFAKGEDIDSSVVKDESKFHLQMTAELLMCDPHLLEDALCKRVMITPEEVIKRSLDPQNAAISRDGLAKTIYTRLFNWLVDKINVSIGQDPNSKCLIGVLDIYGFESFKSNSFEQFCINYTNEKLQQHFNLHVFKMDQKEYVKEGIDWSYIEYVDNQDVLDLIEKKPGGVIALLDEACMFPKSTHETFSNKLYQTFKDHKRLIKPKLTRSDFTIVHYAGEVQYQSDQFLDKNKDYVVPEHQDLLSASKCFFVSGLFPPPPDDSAKSSKFSSIGTRFKQQLNQLMEILNHTDPHYIRCVKPNNSREPVLFDSLNVMQQLRSGGVLEAIKIKCAGYPAYRPYTEFIQRYGILAPEIWKEKYDEKVACHHILETMKITEYKLGQNKIFLRGGAMAELDAHRSRLVRCSATTIQKVMRAFTTRKNYRRMLQESIQIQSRWRGKLARTVYKVMREEAAAVKIQKHLRRQLSTRTYHVIKYSAIILQTGSRALAARNRFRLREKNNGATVIQKNWRSHQAVLCRKKLEEEKRSLQNADRALANLNMEAGDREFIIEKNNYLEKQVVELTFQLELEKQLKIDIAEEKEREVAALLHSVRMLQTQIDETNEVLFKERAEALKQNEPKTLIAETSPNIDDAKKSETLNVEMKKLKELLSEAKERADISEKKYTESQQLNERRRKKLRETEKRVCQLQESLNRMLYSMSDQFAELKMVLNNSLNLTSTSGPVASDELQVDVTSDHSDVSTNGSDFAFAAPNLSPNKDDSCQLVVQDISATEISDYEKWNGDRAGAFDDYF